MKIALCFYGQPRFYDITYHNYFKEVLEQYSPDVYIHTWWGKEMVGSLYPCAKWAESALTEQDRTVKGEVIDNLLRWYNPKKIQYDTYGTVNIRQHKPNYYQFYTQYAVKNLLAEYEKQTGIEYDLIIRTRFDLLINQYVPYQIDSNLWVSNSCPFTDRYNDLFSFSNSSNYKKLSDIYLNLEEFESKGKGEIEWAMLSQIQKESIPVKLFDAQYETFDILRTQTANRYR